MIAELVAEMPDGAGSGDAGRQLEGIVSGRGAISRPLPSPGDRVAVRVIPAMTLAPYWLRADVTADNLREVRWIVQNYSPDQVRITEAAYL